MVAGGKTLNEVEDSRAILPIDSKNIESTVEAFKVYLKRNQMSHLGLLKKEKAPSRSGFTQNGIGNAAYATEKSEYEQRIIKWEERSSMAFSFLYTACKADSDVEMVMTVYLKQCENEDPPRMGEAKELLDKILDRFGEDKRHKLQAAKNNYNDFKVLKGEDLETAMSRLTKIILELIEMNAEPTDQANCLALTKGIQNGDAELENLSTFLAMQQIDIGYNAMKKMVRNFQIHMTHKDGAKEAPSANNINGDVTCAHCHIRGHDVEHCKKRMADRAWHAKNKSGKAGKGKSGTGRKIWRPWRCWQRQRQKWQGQRRRKKSKWQRWRKRCCEGLKCLRC
jgi:hypothetical protein